MNSELLGTLGISFGLGLLVGLQREHAGARFAGIRTFPIITLLGTLLGLLVPYTSGWIVAAGLFGIALLAAASSYGTPAQTSETGRTTEITALFMFGLGVYLVLGERMVAVVLGGGVVVLLHLKTYLHRLVDRFGERDLKLIMQFALLSLVILPVLPNRDYGPFGAWNPREIWLMVVLIVGISIAGYFAYKFLGHKKGTLLGGILGGLISSTATTVTYARKTKTAPNLNRLAALVILIASSIAFLRVIVEVAVVSPNYLPQVAPPLVAAFLLMALLAAGLYWFTETRNEPLPEQKNPAQIKTALTFAALYALILVAVEAAKVYYGSQGLYLVAIISGLTDVDAITLSTANLLNAGKLKTTTAWRIILIASLANLAFKGGMVGFLGNHKLFWQVALLFGLAIAGGLAILFLWPDDFTLDLARWLPEKQG